MATDILTIYKACETGDLNAVKSFLDSNEAKCENEVSGYMMTLAAIKGGHFEILETLWNSSFKHEDTFKKFYFDTYTSQICSYDRFDMLKFVLEHPIVIKTQDQSLMSILPRSVAGSGRLQMLEYLFEKFPNNPGLNANVIEGDILIHAARNGHLNIIEYIFNHNKYKGQIDIHLYKDEAFRVACKSNHLDVLKYFIFDLNIKKTQDIINHINNDHSIMKLFDTQELNNSLKKELAHNQINKKVKI
jgi:hypothetical protein